MDKTAPLSKDPEGIPGRMAKAREGKGITPERLSELSGVRLMAILAMEAGKPGYSLYDLNRARKALGLSLSYVMDGEEETP